MEVVGVLTLPYLLKESVMAKLSHVCGPNALICSTPHIAIIISTMQVAGPPLI